MPRRPSAGRIRLTVESLEAREVPATGSWLVSSSHVGVISPAARSMAVLPRHYPHIRLAALAYNGNPMGPAELEQLRSSIDLVVPNVRYLPTIAAVAPKTPQLVYSNVSNLYLDLLTDWLTFADRHGLTRESAFYHASAATPFAGNSPSSQPVTWFWNVATGSVAGSAGFTRRTAEARGGKPGGVPFGSTGQAVSVGYPDRFRELNVGLSKPADSGWADVLEYPATVDGQGRPLKWKPLTLLTDSTAGMRTSGQLTFDPPPDWKPAIIPGSAAPLYYVRVRSTAGAASDAPVAAAILGRDYVGANGGSSGVIPAFDSTADANHDGYLSDAEYGQRRSGFDARFLYESRLFYPSYGQMRFLTNPSGKGVSLWAANFQKRFLAANPLAAGIFMDNSGGKFPTVGTPPIEQTATYSTDYAALLGAVNRAVSPKWVLANTSGGGPAANGVAAHVPATIEESALRPLAGTWSQFRELANTVGQRLAAARSPGDLILDSLSNGGSPTDPRTQVAALSEYYLLADPERTMFMAWGGEEPASTWARHWWGALAFDVGKPTGTWSQLAAGADPANPALGYQVLQRQYERALVLYKPLSYTPGQGIGTPADSTATVHQLDRNYRSLNADGSLGPVTRSVTLRNGEGAILVPA
jgi:hypothetical protein